MKNANQFASLLEIDFTANEGWLHRFKNRENLVYKQINGEAKSADLPAKDVWLQVVWPEIIKYEPQDIWNAD